MLLFLPVRHEVARIENDWRQHVEKECIRRHRRGNLQLTKF